MADVLDRGEAEQRFTLVFAHLGAVAAYARRRGSSDADGIAAEVMTIAWRRARSRSRRTAWSRISTRRLEVERT